MSAIVEWVAADPSGLGIGLAEVLRLPRPDPGADRLAFRLRGGDLVIVRGPRDRDDRIAAVEVATGSAPFEPIAAGAVSLLGLGLATIDLDRGVAASAQRFGLPPGAFLPATDDAWLGARARVAEQAGVALVVLEPSTEGRLAAALARHGEGSIALYLGLPGPASRSTRPGPLGPAMLIHGPRSWGPFVLAIPAGPVSSRRGGTIGG